MSLNDKILVKLNYFINKVIKNKGRGGLYCESPLITMYPTCAVLGNLMSLLTIQVGHDLAIRLQHIY